MYNIQIMINKIISGSYHLPLAAGHDPNQPDGAGLGRAACPPGQGRPPYGQPYGVEPPARLKTHWRYTPNQYV